MELVDRDVRQSAGKREEKGDQDQGMSMEHMFAKHNTNPTSVDAAICDCDRETDMCKCDTQALINRRESDSRLTGSQKSRRLSSSRKRHPGALSGCSGDRGTRRHDISVDHTNRQDSHLTGHQITPEDMISERGTPSGSTPCTQDPTLQTGSDIPHTDSQRLNPPNGLTDKFRYKYVAGLRDNPWQSQDVNPQAESKSHKSCSDGCCCCPKLLRKRQVKNNEGYDLEKELYPEDDPFRKRCLRVSFNFVYVLLVLVAAVVTYSMIQDLITSMRNPVRSILHKKVEHYDAPGIAVYPGGAKFLACGHYYNNVVTSKVRTSDLDLVNRNCTFTPLKYVDPHYPTVQREVLVIRGPTSFVEREAVFLHFSLNDDTRDFFTVSYFVFPDYDVFDNSTVARQTEMLLDYHRYVPTFALSAGLRMWIKLIMSENFNMSDTKHTDFKVEYSVVKHWDRRPEAEHKDHVFFIFFEWKNDIIETSRLLYTTTPWSIGAGLCGVFLTLHRGYQLAQTSYNRFKKEKQKRSIRKRTLRELSRQKTID